MKFYLLAHVSMTVDPNQQQRSSRTWTMLTASWQICHCWLLCLFIAISFPLMTWFALFNQIPLLSLQAHDLSHVWHEQFLYLQERRYNFCLIYKIKKNMNCIIKCTLPLKCFGSVRLVLMFWKKSLILTKAAFIWFIWKTEILLNITPTKIMLFRLNIFLNVILFLWCKVEFSASFLQSSVSHDPSEIIQICWFAAQETA